MCSFCMLVILMLHSYFLHYFVVTIIYKTLEDHCSVMRLSIKKKGCIKGIIILQIEERMLPTIDDFKAKHKC